MNIDFSLLTNKQQDHLVSLYNKFLSENEKEKPNRFSSIRINISDLQKILFDKRNTEGDIYIDIDSKKYGEGTSFDERTGSITNWRDKSIVGKFTFEDFIPCCDHLTEELLDDLNRQVAYSTGGNYMRWSDLHTAKEKEENCLLGYHTLENGLTFYGMYGTNDGSFPVFFILYFDGEKICGYIPHEGNNFSKKTNRAWGSECSHFHDYAEREEFEQSLIAQLEEYTYFDYDKIKEDILNHISLI